MRYEEAFPRMLESALYEGKQAGNSSALASFEFYFSNPFKWIFFSDEISLSLIFCMLVLSPT